MLRIERRAPFQVSSTDELSAGGKQTGAAQSRKSNVADEPETSESGIGETSCEDREDLCRILLESSSVRIRTRVANRRYSLRDAYRVDDVFKMFALPICVCIVFGPVAVF